jgi:hypothetical protein
MISFIGRLAQRNPDARLEAGDRTSASRHTADQSVVARLSGRIATAVNIRASQKVRGEERPSAHAGMARGADGASLTG